MRGKRGKWAKERRGGPVRGYRENEVRPCVPDGPLDRYGVRRGEDETRGQLGGDGARRGEARQPTGQAPTAGQPFGARARATETIGASLTRDSRTSGAPELRAQTAFLFYHTTRLSSFSLLLPLLYTTSTFLLSLSFSPRV